jgi:hypothetical protein
MLNRMCAGFGMLGLASLVGSHSASAASGGTLRLPHFTPRAKRMVFLFLNGGPSHVDTFDPKPALAKFEGQQPTGKLYRTTGPAFNTAAWNPAAVGATEVGSVHLSFSDPANGVFTSTVNGIARAKPITRQHFANPATVCR